MDKKISLFKHLRLFNAIVTPTVTYGSGSWVMTKTRDAELRTTQRKMLRAIVGKATRQTQNEENGQSVKDSDSVGSERETPEAELIEDECLEPWVDWMRRVTHEALDAMEKLGLADWVEVHRRRLWRWAGHVARREDGRWTTKLLTWIPVGTRAQAHPMTRWNDVLDGIGAQLAELTHSEGS